MLALPEFPMSLIVEKASWLELLIFLNPKTIMKSPRNRNYTTICIEIHTNPLNPLGLFLT